MNTIEFVELVAIRAKLPKSEVQKVFSIAKECVRYVAIKGESVKIGGFGTVKMKERRARMCTNPQTGRAYFCPPRKVLTIKLSKKFEKV